MSCLCSEKALVNVVSCILNAYTFHNADDAAQGFFVFLAVWIKRKFFPGVSTQVEHDRGTVPMMPHVGGGHIHHKGSRTVVNALHKNMMRFVLLLYLS